jgi:hypothetical protein
MSESKEATALVVNDRRIDRADAFTIISVITRSSSWTP